MNLILLVCLCGLYPPPADGKGVAAGQEQLAARFRQYENKLRDASELMRLNEPDRAAVLAKALAKAKAARILNRLDALSETLKKSAGTNGGGDALSAAIKDQQALVEELDGVLKLLQDEDRGGLAKDRREEIERRARDVDRARKEQLELQARTDRMEGKNDEEAKKLAERQAELAERIEKIAGEKTDDSGSEKKLKAAGEAMRKAQRRLEQKSKEDASAAQGEAAKQLDQALADLQQQLQQLREEERRQSLASLEARCRRLLELEKGVRDRTVALDRVPSAQRTRAETQKAIEQANVQTNIVREVDQTRSILRADGTAVTFDEAFETLHSDLKNTAARLQAADVGTGTQALQASAIESLAEMADAFQKQLQESRQPAGESGNDPGARSPLLDRLAELKLLRSLQKRIEQRTEAIAREVGAGVPDARAKAALAELAAQQERVYAIARELALKAGER